MERYFPFRVYQPDQIRLSCFSECNLLQSKGGRGRLSPGSKESSVGLGKAQRITWRYYSRGVLSKVRLLPGRQGLSRTPSELCCCRWVFHIGRLD